VGPLGGGAGNRTASTRETLAFPAIRAVRGPSEACAFPEVSKPHPQSEGRPTVLDVAPFVGLEASVSPEDTARVLVVVARALGLSERELAERLRAAL